MGAYRVGLALAFAVTAALSGCGGCGGDSGNYNAYGGGSSKAATPQTDTPASWDEVLSLSDQGGSGSSKVATESVGVKIGDLIWTRQNISIKTPGSWCRLDSRFRRRIIYGDCAKYGGRHYTWEAAKEACASMGGKWRLPTDEDWDNLMEAVGAVRVVNETAGGEQVANFPYYYKNAGIKLKSTSGWPGGGGTDEYGFSALPYGFRNYNGGGYIFEGSAGYWWSASEGDGFNASCRNMRYDGGSVNWLNQFVHHGLSVRCVTDE